MNTVEPGTKITAPYRNNPEPSWMAHRHTGVVLAMNDPRAWSGSLAFCTREPTQEAVDAHIAKVQSLGMGLGDKVPVLWSFGKVYWERVESLEVVT